MKKLTKKRTALLLIMVIFIGSVLSACAPAAAPGVPAANEAGGAAASGPVRDTVISHIETDVASFDPILSVALVDGTVQRQIFDTLFFITQNQELQPRISTHHEVSPDGMTYIFHLRDDVLFHNGDLLTAEDVAFSIMRSKDSPSQMIFVENVEYARALDDFTVEVAMSRPGVQFITYIGNLFIVNRRAVEEMGDDFARNPVGSGPYMLVRHDPDNQVVLTRFDDYFRGPARIEHVIFRVITDLNAATIAIQAGDVDIGAVSSAAHVNIYNDPNLNLEVFESLRIDYFIPNHNAFPFDNVLVRRAVSYALDRQLLVDLAVDGFGTPTSAMIPRTVVGFSELINQAFLTPDLDRARELIAEAGIETPLDIGTIICFDSHRLDVQVLQQTLAEIGLIADIEVMELNRLVEEFASGNFVIGAVGISLHPDADSYSLLFTSGGGFNFAGYVNPVMDEMWIQASVEQDPIRRQELYAEIFAIADDDVVYIPGYLRQSIYAYNVNLIVDYFDNRTQQMFEMHWRQ